MNASHDQSTINDPIRVALRGGSTPSPQPAKRQRRRRGRGKGKGKNKQIKLQKRQHEEVIGRLEEICGLLSLTLDEIVDFVDRGYASSHASSYQGCSDGGSVHGQSEGPHFGTTTTDRPSPSARASNPVLSAMPPYPHPVHPLWYELSRERCYSYSEASPSPCSSYSPRFLRPVTPITEAGIGSTKSNGAPVETPASSFHMLQLDLESTRERLQDLQAIVETAPVDNIRASVRQLADGLQESLDQDLQRLYTINGRQQEEALSYPVHRSNDQETSVTTTSGLTQQHASHQTHKRQYVTPVRSVASTNSHGTSDSATMMTPSSSCSTPCPKRSHSSLFTPDGKEFADFDGWTWVASDPDWQHVDIRDCAPDNSKRQIRKGAGRLRERLDRFGTGW
ncbi:hypothetical protein F5Y18DRAFT_317413 [Xylariaceae sp. FL1019]|nr:hypothetical protein F5Y18DRAFT_317413 [Xylariaceae sp. FL1019]